MALESPPSVPTGPAAPTSSPPAAPTSSLPSSSPRIFWLNGRPYLCHSFLGRGGFADVWKVELLVPAGMRPCLLDGEPLWDDLGRLRLESAIPMTGTSGTEGGSGTLSPGELAHAAAEMQARHFLFEKERIEGVARALAGAEKSSLAGGRFGRVGTKSVKSRGKSTKSSLGTNRPNRVLETELQQLPREKMARAATVASIR